MTRFSAETPRERVRLIVDAITAHRERASPYLTIEIDETSFVDGIGPDPDLGVPWIQFADGTISLDCTDDELERLKGLLSQFPAFKIEELIRPEDADGTNARVSAKADANRIAQFCESVVQEVFDCPEDTTIWIVAV
ncbi:hypothetical protein OB919_12830 [Halobacteria archaeon AArc-curdl1]|uniref:DUF7975 domain-containing protein n=1 Tax=Natronosalvus hydrolyticus TaxID=2979988 RepID=A0AAP2ZA72_9EURY|nr:hypothetical protein [Halobacteria archaeon AArc-curdl1]